MTQPEQFSLLNHISDSILVIESDYTISFANQSFLDLYDAKSEEVVGNKCYQLLHKSPFPCTVKPLSANDCVHKQVFETGLPVTLSHLHTMPDRSRRFLQISASPINDEKGNVLRLISIIKDVSSIKELQDTLAENLAQHETIINYAPFSVSYLDREMRIVKINPLMEQLVGHTNEEVKGLHCYDVWGEYALDESKQGTEKICDTCKTQYTLADGQTYSYERKVGEHYIEVKTSPVRDNSGVIIGSLECGLDITERKKAEETLKSYENIISTTQDLMSFVDKNYVYKAVNDAYCKIHKISRDKIINHSVAKLFGEDVFNTKIKAYLDRALSGEQIHYEAWFNYPGNNKRYMDVKYYPYYTQENIISGVVVNVSDSTDRKLAEIALRESENRYSYLYDNLSDAVFIMDLSGRFLDVNEVTVKRLGYTRNELLKMTPKDINSPEYAQGVKSRIKKAMENQRLFFESIHVTKDGKLIPTEINSNLIKYNGKPAILALARDITDRKKVEEDLKKSEQRLELALKGADLGLWDWDIQTNQTYFSPRYFSMLGYTQHEHPHTIATWENLLHPEDKIRIGQELKSCLEEYPSQWSLTFRMKTKDGHYRWIQSRGKVVEYGPDRTPIRATGTHLDITISKITENKLLESEERFRELFNNMSSCVAIYDAAKNGSDFIIKDFNKAALLSSNIEYKDVLGKSVRECFPGFEKLGLLNVFQRVLKTGVPETLPCSFYKDDRIAIWVENYVCRLPSGEIVAIYDDVTERKKAEDAIIQAKEEWQKSFDSIKDIVTIQDKSMRIVRANKAAFDFFETAPGDLIGKHCYEIFRGINEPCPGCPTVKTAKDIKNHTEIIQHDNLGKIFQVSSSAIENDNGEVQYLVHIAKDITEQKRLEEELFQAHKMEAIGTLAGGIAHDFNNILSAIIGFTELAKAELEEGSTAAADLSEVLQASQRATGLVKQVLTFSRKSSIKKDKLQPYLIIKEALKLLRASLPTTLTIEENIDKESGTILSDPTKLHQLVVNLCTNALHAMEEETGTLKISLNRKLLNSLDVSGHPDVLPGPFIELSVEDSGCGMDEQTRLRIFEPYFTTKATGKGTGLGLAVVLGIVQDHHGMITVDSEVGKGTTFHVYFPAITEEVKKIEVAEERRQLPKGTERILIVDDESTIVTLQKTVLSRLGYTVTPMTSSEEALAVFRSEPDSFDLLITDQTMPGLSGSKLAQEILSIRPDIMIILCTGYSATLSEERAMSIGIKKYLTKPVDSKELARVVRSVLDEN